ncbi:MAG: lipopolysaccharide biosynthesis protein [Thermodesulfovibrionales bacterium]
MSFARRAAKNGLWFAGSRFVTQLATWFFTLYIARLLSPEDYGLMTMASFLTAYLEEFSELGLGSAIIQREKLTPAELSGVFSLSLLAGGALAVLSFFLAYPTAWIFNERRIVPVTQLISLLFLIGALGIVPYNLLMREGRFRAIGGINFVSALLSSCAMVVMAMRGYGVFTLIGGTLILRSAKTLLIIFAAGWRPQLLFRFSGVKPFLSFGIHIALSSSLFRLFQTMDKFVVGKMFAPPLLGSYSFAMELAGMPTEKIVAVIQQVSFPVLSRYQGDRKRMQELYLKITKYIALIVTPLFVGGVFLADEIIPALLGPRWRPIIPLFRLFCITHFVISLTTINGAFHNAQGRPHWVLRFTLLTAAMMTAALVLAGKQGFSYLAVPWITLCPALHIGWTAATLKKLGISTARYAKNLLFPLFATLCMVFGIKGVQLFASAAPLVSFGAAPFRLVLDICAGMLLYVTYLFLFERETLHEIWTLRKA